MIDKTCLGPCFSGCLVGTFGYETQQNQATCLGPCFSGCLVGTPRSWIMEIRLECLGPCFSGCLVGTKAITKGFYEGSSVSVLVLVDVWWVPGEHTK